MAPKKYSKQCQVSSFLLTILWIKNYSANEQTETLWKCRRKFSRFQRSLRTKCVCWWDREGEGPWLWPPLPRFSVQFDLRWKNLTTCPLRSCCGQFSFRMNGAGDNKMVLGVSFFFSSGSSPAQFTPLIKPSQPTIRSRSLCARGQSVCWAAHRGVTFVLQNKLVIPAVSLYRAGHMRESNCVGMCYSIHWCLPRRVPLGRTNGKPLAAKCKSNRWYQSHPYWDNCCTGSLIREKCHGCVFHLKVTEGAAWVTSMRWHTMFNSSNLPTCERHLILIHSLHSSQLIDVSTGADNLRLAYIWLWKYLNEIFSTSTFLI